MSVEHDPINILLVDDHPMIHVVMGTIVRWAFKTATLHSAEDIEGALEHARGLETLGLVLLDLGLPGCSGTEALVRFRTAFPTVPLVVISAVEDPATINAVLAGGARGFVPKTSRPNVIVSALQLVVNGGVYVPPEALGRMPSPAESSRPISSLSGKEGVTVLTERQIEVMSLVAKGYQNRQIALTLDVSESTVKQHLHTVFIALGVSSRAQAIAAATQRGILRSRTPLSS